MFMEIIKLENIWFCQCSLLTLVTRRFSSSDLIALKNSKHFQFARPVEEQRLEIGKGMLRSSHSTPRCLPLATTLSFWDQRP